MPDNKRRRRKASIASHRQLRTKLTRHAGPLSAIGDPVGQIADKALRPVGAITGSVGKPAGEALLNVEDQAKEEVGMKEKADGEKPGGERIGGKEQTAKNPLGL